MPNLPAKIGPFRCGPGQPLLVIAGPCVLETADSALWIAEKLAALAESRDIQLIFKGSFDKANRTSIDAVRGPGLEEGLRILEHVRTSTGLMATTDIHEASQAAPVAEVCDLLQVPAFLVRQTDLLVAAARTGKAVNAKKGQFLSPGDMKHVVGKLSAAGCENILLCERGTFFGYGRLVNDMVRFRRCRPLVHRWCTMQRTACKSRVVWMARRVAIERWLNRLRGPRWRLVAMDCFARPTPIPIARQVTGQICYRSIDCPPSSIACLRFVAPLPT